jgi:AcrR family transcriptional regulator
MQSLKKRNSITESSLSLDALPPFADEKMSTTAKHILDVSEKLFAKHGLDSVSARDIATASGQRNISAVSYHFGTREGLLGTLLSRRMHVLNQRREECLLALERTDESDSIHSIIGVSFGVLANVVQNEAWGPDFVMILAQVFFHPELKFTELVSPELQKGNQLALKMGRKALPKLSLRLFLDRAEMAYNNGTFVLAQWVRKNGAITPENSREFDLLKRNTVDFLAAGVMAPVSSGCAVRRQS